VEARERCMTFNVLLLPLGGFPLVLKSFRPDGQVLPDIVVNVLRDPSAIRGHFVAAKTTHLLSIRDVRSLLECVANRKWPSESVSQCLKTRSLAFVWGQHMIRLIVD